MHRWRTVLVAGVASCVLLAGCEHFALHDTASLLDPRLMRSEVMGIAAGFGTTFAALPDVVAMFRRKSAAGMKPRMAAIIGAFQILWVYYGLLILSRPVVIWNVLGVLMNCVNVWAYFHFTRREKRAVHA